MGGICRFYQLLVTVIIHTHDIVLAAGGGGWVFKDSSLPQWQYRVLTDFILASYSYVLYSGSIVYWKTSTAPCGKVYRGYSPPCLTSFWPQRAWQVDKSTVPSAKGLTRAHSLENDTFVSVAISCYSMCEVTDLFWPRSARGHIHCTMCQGYTSQPTLWKT